MGRKVGFWLTVHSWLQWFKSVAEHSNNAFHLQCVLQVVSDIIAALEIAEPDSLCSPGPAVALWMGSAYRDKWWQNHSAFLPLLHWISQLSPESWQLQNDPGTFWFRKVFEIHGYEIPQKVYERCILCKKKNHRFWKFSTRSPPLSSPTHSICWWSLHVPNVPPSCCPCERCWPLLGICQLHIASAISCALLCFLLCISLHWHIQTKLVPLLDLSQKLAILDGLMLLRSDICHKVVGH